MIKGAIFDKDGILFDTQREFMKGWELAGKIQGIEVSHEFLIEMAGCNKYQSFSLIEKYYPTVDSRKMREDMLVYVTERQQNHLTLKPGVKEVLQYLQDHNYPIALASGGLPEMVEGNITRGGIKDYFDVITHGLDVQKAKPEPDIFLLACQRLNLKPEECVVFEDSPQGLKASRRAGCISIMIPDCFEATEEVKPNVDYIFKDFFEVIQAFKDGTLK